MNVHIFVCFCIRMCVHMKEKQRVGFEGFKGQELRARLGCRRYRAPYFGYVILPHVDWPARCIAQKKSQKKYTK